VAGCECWLHSVWEGGGEEADALVLIKLRTYQYRGGEIEGRWGLGENNCGEILVVKDS
jgi:hypothetical protein